MTPQTLFLDFDGVLNNDVFIRQQRNHPPKDGTKVFDPTNRTQLNRLCEQLPVDRIVISSSWKVHHSLPKLRGILTGSGFEHAAIVVDVTVDIGAGPESREAEILCWIEQSRLVNFVIIDDFQLSQDFEGRYFRTASWAGLTAEIVDSILQR